MAGDDFSDFKAHSANLEQVRFTKFLSSEVKLGRLVLGNDEPHFLFGCSLQNGVKSLIDQIPVEDPKSVIHMHAC